MFALVKFYLAQLFYNPCFGMRLIKFLVLFTHVLYCRTPEGLKVLFIRFLPA